MEKETIKIIDAHREPFLSAARTLFESYEASLDVDLCFQQFERELALLPGDYAPPTGCLLIARDGEVSAGCVALRSIDPDCCEMKRLYVAPSHRGRGIGISLILEVIQRASNQGYRAMRLDTLPSMKKAISLYVSLGFVEIDPYRTNPVAGVRYLELDLTNITIHE